MRKVRQVGFILVLILFSMKVATGFITHRSRLDWLPSPTPNVVYHVYRTQNPTIGGWSLIAGGAQIYTKLYFVDWNVVSGQTYSYKVNAYDKVIKVESVDSAIATGTIP